MHGDKCVLKIAWSLNTMTRIKFTYFEEEYRGLYLFGSLVWLPYSTIVTYEEVRNAWDLMAVVVAPNVTGLDQMEWNNEGKDYVTWT